MMDKIRTGALFQSTKAEAHRIVGNNQAKHIK